MSFLRNKPLQSLIEKSNNQASQNQLLKQELEKLSSEELSLKLADQKEGANLVDKILDYEELLLLVLKKTAGTKDRKDSTFFMQENHGRHRSASPLPDEIIKDGNGGYLLDICKSSKKFEDFLLAKGDSLKEKRVIDDLVIIEVTRASESRKVQNMSFNRYYD